MAMTLAGLFDTIETVIPTCQKWTKGAHARSKHGSHVRADAPNACSVCLNTAFRRAFVMDGGLEHSHLTLIRDKAWEILNDTIMEMFPTRTEGRTKDDPQGCVIAFNDHPDTTFDDVRAVVHQSKANAYAIRRVQH